MKKRLIALVLGLLVLSGCAHTVPRKPLPTASSRHTATASAAASATASAVEMPLQTPRPLPEQTENGLIVHFIYVGHGDCILIQSGNKNMLIDTGMPQYTQAVIQYLWDRGIRELDSVLITHPHIDHIGGLAEIIREFPIKELIMTTAVGHDIGYESAVNAIQKHGLNVVHPQVGDRIRLGKAVLTVLAPKQLTCKDLNNTSIVTRLVFGKTSLLLAGDASVASEIDMLANAKSLPLQSSLLKCGHHGGASSTSQAFLDAVKPQYAVITAAKTQNENKKFPSPVVLKRLKALGVKPLCLGQTGTVVVRSDGETLQIESSAQPDSNSDSRVRRKLPTAWRSPLLLLPAVQHPTV